MNKPEKHENFEDVLKMISNARIRAYHQVNSILIELYWTVGKYVSEKVAVNGWGKNVVEDLAKYIAQKDATIKGFSANGIWRMKKFYETYKNLPQCGKTDCRQNRL